jgi:hypothetical protein
MAQPRPKSVGPLDAPARAGRRARPEYLGEASGAELGAASPALKLQSQLDSAFAEPSKDAGARWSPRATLLLAGGAAMTLWLALVASAWALSRAF